jgi:sulfhydrogenase subunit beta (sulfur reductase)
MDRVAKRTPAVMATSALEKLIQLLVQRGYEVLGPVVRDGAIVYDQIEGLKDLPAGWTDDQEAGHYRITRRNDGALFGFNLGPQSWKKFLHPPEVKLFEAEAENGTMRIVKSGAQPTRYAFIGVRACELAAIAIQDRVLLNDKYADPIYAGRRDGVFIVAVQCTQAAATCFCHSLKTGPRARVGFDLAMTELLDQAGHRFLIEAGSERGEELLAELDHAPAAEEDCERAQTAMQEAAEQQVRQLDASGIKELLYQNFEHPRWNNVAERCLACANCTMVCPTCFCTTVEDTSDLTGNHAERWRRWDSCFTLNFSYIHGGSVRMSPRARYRQWLTHKLASWNDQFGSSGCVGCGRCITWCPVGIDLTEEVEALRGTVDHGNTDS